MNTKTKFLIAVSAIAFSATANAHMEPKKNTGMEKCYGVSKAHKNDCASANGKHSCSGRAKTDKDPNEWIKTPKGLCLRLTNASLTPPSQEHDEDEHGNHEH